jgi:hypothetical protein
MTTYYVLSEPCSNDTEGELIVTSIWNAKPGQIIAEFPVPEQPFNPMTYDVEEVKQLNQETRAKAEAFLDGYSIGKKDTDGLSAVLFFGSSCVPDGDDWEEFSKGFLRGQVEIGKNEQAVKSYIAQFAQGWIESEQKQDAATAFMENQDYQHEV